MGDLIVNSFFPMDYADAYRAGIPDNGPCSVDQITYSLFGSMSGLMRVLLIVRDVIASFWGLKTAVGAAAIRDDGSPIEPGDRVGFFKVYQRTNQEILLGEDDLHLDFRVSVRYRRAWPDSDVTVSTYIRFNNRFGRIYFALIKPFHCIVVRETMRKAIRRRRV